VECHRRPFSVIFFLLKKTTQPTNNSILSFKKLKAELHRYMLCMTKVLCLLHLEHFELESSRRIDSNFVFLNNKFKSRSVIMEKSLQPKNVRAPHRSNSLERIVENVRMSKIKRSTVS